MSTLLRKLLGLLFPGVGEDDDLPDPDALDDTADDSADDTADDSADDTADDSADDPVPQRTRSRQSRDDESNRTVKEALDRARRLEEDVEALKRSNTAPNREQAEEDRKLADPATDPMEKWQIQANRTLRATQQEASAALREARDMQDRATFMAKAATDPRREKFADRIEKELTSLRAKGQNVDRETLYYYQLGKDVSEGKLKAAPKKTTAAAVPRGKTVPARSDVRGSRNSRSASGLRERLADKPI